MYPYYYIKKMNYNFKKISVFQFPHLTKKENNDSYHRRGMVWNFLKLQFIVHLQLFLVIEKCYASIFKLSNIIKRKIHLTK